MILTGISQTMESERTIKLYSYYNKSELPPYGFYEVETNMQALTLTPESKHSSIATASS